MTQATANARSCFYISAKQRMMPTSRRWQQHPDLFLVALRCRALEEGAV